MSAPESPVRRLVEAAEAATKSQEPICDDDIEHGPSCDCARKKILAALTAFEKREPTEEEVKAMARWLTDKAFFRPMESDHVWWIFATYMARALLREWRGLT